MLKIDQMYKKKFLIYFFLLFLNFNNSYSDIINQFKISGNDRISDETIILFSGYKVNDNIDESDLNKIIKEL